LNAAKGDKISQINTDQLFYDEINVEFFGSSLMDTENCDIESHFEKATEFIHKALDLDKG
jgi:hypothetical protein